MKKSILIVCALSLFIGMGASSAFAGPENTAATCSDGKDNDKDKLIDCADLVFDNYGLDGDAAVQIPGCPTAVSATSTVVGSALLQALTAATVAELQRRGHTPPVWQSDNGEAGDRAHAAYLAEYQGRIKRL